jgi:PAS domain S-box-containing protein
MAKERSPWWVRYGWAVVSTALAALLARAIPAPHSTGSALFAAAIMVAAAFGGLGSSLLALALSVLSLHYLFAEHTGVLNLGLDDLVRMGSLGVVVILAAWLGLTRREAADGSEVREGFEAFMGNSPTFAYMKDGEGRYLYVNRSVEEVFGRSPDGWLGKTDLDLFPPEAAARYRKHDQQVLASGTAMQFSERVVGLQGELHLLSFKFPIAGRRGQPILAGISVDITERTRAQEAMRQSEEAAKEADRRKDEFLALLGHELRNPLGPIRHAVQILRMAGPTEDQLEQARDVIDRQVIQISCLLDDLLDVSRIASGRVRLHREVHDLGAVVRTAAEDHRAMLETTGVGLKVEIPEGALRVRGDATRLSQVVGNLLHNAGKFTDSGGVVTVRVTENRIEEEALILVEDTGIGMDAHTLAVAFEPFRQSEASVHRARGGLGVGLALVKGLVDLHGGSVTASSEGPGRGSRLIVRLPLADDSPSPRSVCEDKNAGGRSIRILVIEDHADAAESLALLLEMLGHKVEIANTGRAGIEVAGRFSPELVLCDLGLPDLDGYEVARALRQEPRLAGVFLVALSGYGQESDKRRAQEAGFDRHICKPIDPSELKRIVAEIGDGSL